MSMSINKTKASSPIKTALFFPEGITLQGAKAIESRSTRRGSTKRGNVNEDDL